MTEEEKYPAPPDNFPEEGSNASGSDRAYSVQARLAYPDPRQVCGHLLDLRWRTLHFDRSPIGVPENRGLAPVRHGLLSYQAAQALRWWFLANADAEFSCLCIETRLIEHKVQYSYSTTAMRAVAPIGGADRSNIMFDWGKKPPPAPQAEAAE